MTSAEVGLRQVADDPVRALGRIERGHALADEPGRHEQARLEAAVAGQSDAEDAADRQRPTQREDAVAGEVAERVRDQAALVPLHAAKDVRSMTDHEIS